MTSHYDVIVVGAGNGGLMAAALAAKMGKQVLLVERHNIAGGAASSFCRGRFEFETVLHELGNFGSTKQPGMVRQLFNQLGLNVKMYRVPTPYREIVMGPNGYDADMPEGRDAFIGKLAALVPGSRKAAEHFFALAAECEQAMGALGKMPPEQLNQQFPNFVRYATVPFRTVLNEIGMPPKAEHILEAYWSYAGMPGTVFQFGFFATLIYSCVVEGTYLPENRSHEITTALCAKIEELGGEIWLNTTVDHLIVRDGAVCGIEIDGHPIFAKKVITCASPNTVYDHLLPTAAIPQRVRQLTNARQLALSAGCVYLGLNKSPEELGIKNYTLFVSRTGDTQKNYDNTADFQKNDFLLMNCLNCAVPDCSPAGTTILFGTKFYRTGVWDNVQPQNYQKMKDQMAEDFLSEYEEATGIHVRDAIEEIETVSPATFARYMNTPDGEVLGYYGQSWDQTLQRMMSLHEEAEPVPGLLFCGGHGAMMDGYSSAYATGAMAAQQAIAEINEEEEHA